MFGVCAGTVISSSEGSLHDLSDLWHRSDVKPRFWKPKKIPSSLTIFGAVFDHRVCILEPHKAWNLKGIIKTPHCSRPELPEKNFQVFEVHLERKGQMPQWRSATSWESIGEWWFPISNFKCPISNSYTIPIFDPLESLVSKFRLQNETFCRPTLSIERCRFAHGLGELRLNQKPVEQISAPQELKCEVCPRFVFFVKRYFPGNLA